MADWPSRQNKENKDVGIPDMQLDIDDIETTANIPDFLTIQELQQTALQGKHLQQLKEHIIKG